MPNRNSWIVVVAILIAALAAPAAAQDEPFDLDLRINLQLAGAPAVDVFKSFAAMANAEPDLDPGLEGEVTIQLTSVSARTTMNAICEMLSCKWWFEDGSPRRLMVRSQKATSSVVKESSLILDTPVSLSLRDAPVEEVFKSFASVGRWALVMEKTTVSVELDNTPIRQALDEVCAQVNCVWALDEAGGQATLRVDWVD
jgi:hypothetical protein